MRVALLVALAVLSPFDPRAAPEGSLPPTQRVGRVPGAQPDGSVRAPRPLWKALGGERGLKAYGLVNQCEQRRPNRCGLLAAQYAEGRGVPRDDAIAAVLLESSCKAGSDLACSSLGLLLAYGEGVPRDFAWARELQQKTCSNRVAIGCAALGDLLLPPAPEPVRDAEVVALYERGCEGKNIVACNNLGWMLERGRGAPRDLARSRALYARACHDGLGVGCKNLGVVHAASTRGEELAEAVRLLEPFCAKEPATCNLVGSVEERRGERARALAAYARGCEAGHARSCNNQGFLLGLTHTPEDEARARALFERACDGGVGLACSNAATLAPPERARSLNARACELGVQGVCVPEDAASSP